MARGAAAGDDWSARAWEAGGEEGACAAASFLSRTRMTLAMELAGRVTRAAQLLLCHLSLCLRLPTLSSLMLLFWLAANSRWCRATSSGSFGSKSSSSSFSESE